MTLVSFADLRQAWRGLRRAPMISFCAITCLALGLGITTAVSSAIDRAMLQPLPFRDPASLVTVYRTAPQANTWPMSAPNYLDLAAAGSTFSGLAAIAQSKALLSLPDRALQVDVLRVTANLFALLGVTAEHGRMLLTRDDSAAEAQTAVLSDQFWRDQFGADPAIIGRSIRLNGNLVTVVGIAPPGFRIPRGGKVLSASIWVPIRFTAQERAERGSNWLMVMGRLAPHATIATAQNQLQRTHEALSHTYPMMQGEGVRVVPLAYEATHAVQGPLLLLFGAVAIVLLIAATDVASLLLARGVQRRREMAVRLALGGGRWAVMRPVLLESLLLAAIGVAVGLALAYVGVRTIGALAAQRLPQLAGLSIDFRVVGFALGLAIVVSVLCGGFPAWRSAATDPQVALRGGRGGGLSRGHHRILAGLVIAEVALSLVLLLGAGLVLKGFARLSGNDPGFDPAPILTLQTVVSPQNYPDNTGIRRFLEPALTAIGGIPGVAAAGSIQLIPYVEWGWNFNIRYEGQPAVAMTQLPLAEVRVVTPGFFAVTRQRLLSGRLLTESDDDRPQSPAVAVVNEALVKRDFGGRDPIGKRYYTGDTTFSTIVGVVSDIRNAGPFAAPQPEVYVTYLQDGLSGIFPILVRVNHGGPAAVAAAVTAAIRHVDPEAAVSQVAPMTDVIANSIGQPRFYLTLLITFAAVAVLLALAGLYGVMSYVVAQRTRELGIRSALGSGTRGILQLVTLQGGRLVGAGLVIGLAASTVVTRLLTGLLYGVSPLDPVTWLAAAVLLVAAGIAATLIPALRAARVDPATAMRIE
ncbi:MAG TPA: ABC transporter permease [Gemmatimonadales bacterium]|nr:ABC transporter permease [Gemmatimonadales bacterium]